jgi:filamentous hemagglutinin
LDGNGRSPEDCQLGKVKAAQAYRAKQDELINSGKLREAIQMDIDDIRSKFGNKYDAHIKQMLESFGFSQ